MTLNEYKITPKAGIGHDVVKTITAKSVKSAWGKFCTQYFGVMKPSRKNYSIRRIS